MGKDRAGLHKGYWGKILHVDLAARTISHESMDEHFYRKLLGGVGIGAKVLWDRMKPGVDPLGPENVLGFTPGLLTDTGTLFTGRFTVAGKSPASGGWGDANCGGYFSPRLKRCGIDSLFLTGASSEPVYLYLDHEKAELRDASRFWGMDTVETERALKSLCGKAAQVACIGPAGERLSTMAGICNDGGRMAARCGLGAVMGSKRLKAVVAAGKSRVGIADREAIRDLNRSFLKAIDRFRFLEGFLGDRVLGLTGRLARPGFLYTRQPSDLWRLILRKFGTPSLTALSAESGDSPVRNWTGVGYRDFPLSRSQKIGAETVVGYQVSKYGCFSCPIRCGGKMRVPEGPRPIEEMHKPEYETICAFGTLLLNNDLQSIFRINDLLNRAGMDSISCGGAVAFAVECFENGVLSMADTDGLELRWGEGEAMVRLVGKIIRREGIGDILADGVKRAAARIGRGSEQYAVHCGGVEAPMHDPKFDPGFILSYSCEPTPGRHTISSYQYLDLQHLEKQFQGAGKVPFFTTRKGRYRYEGRGDALAVDSFYKMIVDCAGACLFGTQVGGPIPLCDWMNAVTGWDLTADEYLLAGQRVHLLRHAFNVREGLNPARDFRPHPRLCGIPPLDSGPARKVTVDFDTLARSYYEAMGWEWETGRPLPARLKELGLEELGTVLGGTK
ncbi:MAG: aldehyde ferredoxin oxidoreductase family protein [Deltaproteobacteria bacterium]|nr:aldehyde ferredoxin oxidoreductase family protein [Deltaproteobacteria bacterium]